MNKEGNVTGIISDVSIGKVTFRKFNKDVYHWLSYRSDEDELMMPEMFITFSMHPTLIKKMISELERWLREHDNSIGIPCRWMTIAGDKIVFHMSLESLD